MATRTDVWLTLPAAPAIEGLRFGTYAGRDDLPA